jgi:hypothetical protein
LNIGEPMFAIVHVTNVGPDPVAYSKCEGRVQLAVAKQRTRQAPNLWGCFSGLGSGSGGCGVDHPPILAPGTSTDFHTFYATISSDREYVLRVSGKAGVRWKFTSDYRSHNTAPAIISAFHGDPAPGEHFDLTIPLTVRSGTEVELQKAYEPYVNGAKSYELFTSYPAREAIGEMALHSWKRRSKALPPILKRPFSVSGAWSGSIRPKSRGGSYKSF